MDNAIAQLFSLLLNQPQMDQPGGPLSFGDLVAQRLGAQDPYQGSPDRGQLGRVHRDNMFWQGLADSTGAPGSQMNADIATGKTRHEFVLDGRLRRQGAVPLADRTR